LSTWQGNCCSITQKSFEIWPFRTDLPQMYLKSDRPSSPHSWQAVLVLNGTHEIKSNLTKIFWYCLCKYSSSCVTARKADNMAGPELPGVRSDDQASEPGAPDNN